MAPKVIVIGAGVIGLSTSRLLLRKGYHVVNVARHFPGDKDILYTSMWAGAHYRPIPDTDALTRRVADFARATYAVFTEIAETDVSSGVKMLDGYEYLDDTSGDYDAHKWGRYAEIDGFQVLEDSQLPTGTKFGTKYKTYCVNPPVYLAWLERELVLGGVQFIRRDLTCIAEVFPLIKDPDVQLVVNCSGIGFSDPDVFPTRGQTVIVANRCDRTITRQHPDGTWTFIIPRPLNGGTVVGGTKQPNDYNPYVDEKTRETILEKAAKMYPPIITNGLPPNGGGFQVISDIVGRRPSRNGGPRVEAEVLDGKTIVHAYGMGGSGIEMSWGVAAEAVRLVEEHK